MYLRISFSISAAAVAIGTYLISYPDVAEISQQAGDSRLYAA
jgi:hypothetical protein